MDDKTKAFLMDIANTLFNTVQYPDIYILIIGDSNEDEHGHDVRVLSNMPSPEDIQDFMNTITKHEPDEVEVVEKSRKN